MTRKIPGAVQEYLPASAKQLEYLVSLVKTHEWPSSWEYTVEEAERRFADLTKDQASALISVLKMSPRSQPLPAVTVADIVGLWVGPANQIVRIQPNKAGTSYYAQTLQGADDNDPGTWVYEGRGFADKTYRLGRRMTEAEIADYGHLTVHCLLCGRELTHPDSIARGIGPGPHKGYDY